MGDLDYAAIARRLSCPRWLVIAAPYRGGLSAFAACTPYRLIIDETDPEVLRSRMRAAEMAAVATGMPDRGYGAQFGPMSGLPFSESAESSVSGPAGHNLSDGRTR